MNFILIVAGIILLTGIIIGTCKGAVRIAVSLGATILTLVLVFFVTPFAAKAITKYTPVEEMIENQVVGAMAGLAVTEVKEKVELTADGVRKALKAAGVSEEMLIGYGISVEDIVDGNVSSEELAQYGISSSVLDGFNSNLKDQAEGSLEDFISDAEIPRDMQIKAIEKADIPNLFKELLTTNNNSEVYKSLGVKTFAQYVGHYLAKLIINIIAFLCTFILITIVIRAIVFSLDIVSELPLLGVANHLAGGVAGAVGALIVIWTLFIIVTLLYTTDIGKDLYQMIQANPILKFFYDFNPIMKLAVKL